MGLANIAEQNLADKDFVLDCIRKSRASSKYLMNILNDILDMSRVETGNIVLEDKQFLVQSFIENINTLMHALAQQADIRYTCQVEIDQPRAFVGDVTRLQQILVNLLNNACKFTKAGGQVRLLAQQRGMQGEKMKLHFEVADTGVGISPAFLPQLFCPFSQEKTGTTATYAGSGLGLAIAQKLAQLMQGEITVQSMPGVGSTVFVDILLAPDFSLQNAAQQPQKLQAYNFAGSRVLLVEDHPLNTMVATKLLEGKGFAVDHAENGKRSVEIFAASRAGTYQAVLMDIRMPVMDGLEAAALIRALPHPDAKTVPIIAMTANAYEADIRKSREAGMCEHLAKPIEPEMLYSTLQKYIHKK